MYAVVDIETTGGLAGSHRITEIAIILHDGKEVTETYQTLVNPEQEIPPFITQLTGISNEMVETAPVFADIAPLVYDMLLNRIFVAHNAPFDYTFIRHMLEVEGYAFKEKKLCTVRLSRKLIPGLPSYSLGKLCREIGIDIENRHRAMGDARATAELFRRLLSLDQHGVAQEMLQKHQGQQTLPPYLDKEKLKQIPVTAGVYYFRDDKGRILYVGKARNLRSRVKNHFHFADHDGQENKLREAIHQVSAVETGNDLIALLLETDEIKRKKPPYNKALKYWSRSYCIFGYTGQNGYLHLAIEKYKPGLRPVVVIPGYLAARQLLKEVAVANNLCLRYCHLQRSQRPCIQTDGGHCHGACKGKESPSDYNQRVKEAMRIMEAEGQNLIVTGAGRNEQEMSVVLVERGLYLGYGFLSKNQKIQDINDLKPYIQPKTDHPEIHYIIRQHLSKYPQSEFKLTSQNNTN